MDQVLRSDHKDPKSILAKPRNRVSASKFEKLNFRYAALSMHFKPEKYLDLLEALVQAAGFAEDTRRNIFYLFQKDLEDLTVDERRDEIMRFRLLSQKYKNIFMISDVREEYDDYRVVVYMKLSQQKLKEYGNK